MLSHVLGSIAQCRAAWGSPMIFGMRAPSSLRRVAVAIGFVSLAGAAAWFGLSAESVDAQQPENPTIGVESLIDDSQLGADITIDPGTTEPGAMQGQLSYDPSVITFVECDHLDGFGACRAEDGIVHFGSFVVESWATESSVVTLNFEILEEEGASQLDLDVEMVFDVDGNRLEYDVVDGIYGSADDLDETTPIDAVDAQGGIEGRIVNADGAGVAAVNVCATSDLTGRRTCDDTDVFGDYAIEGLATAPYTMSVDDPQGIYEDGAASDVAVISPKVTSDLNITIALPADTDPDTGSDNGDSDTTTPDHDGGARDFVSGTVRDADLAGVAGVLVCADGVGNDARSCDLTAGDGSYRIDGLSSGNYQISANDPQGRFADADTRTVALDSAVGRPGLNFGVEAG